MKTILLIEDNEIMRENTVEILELFNYNVLSAENGKLGIELAINKRPDLIICDITMPAIDEIEVLKNLNNNGNGKKIPFIFLTARVEKSEMINEIIVGFDEYITKPYQGDELLRIVSKYLPL